MLPITFPCVYVCPKYVFVCACVCAQVRGYRRLLREKRSELGEKANKLKGGLQKLDETSTQVCEYFCSQFARLYARAHALIGEIWSILCV